ncbi:AraC family transcriptional regulator [Roseibium salinum]|uniref:AraC family transcriptional regulator n=1 Tax=Roseibium salinum TaxID=1604349 RepID=A0ABT3QXF6_9HYPH|nr:AraC family transcriptional regulator [Roseibium sp. DSM 29163]MCX2721624.1 AraC family transcriptional regulator [Roseibium sp. DSM 29163]
MLSRLIEHRHGMRRIEPPKGGLGLFCMASGAGYELRVNEVYSWDGLQRGDIPFVLIQHTIAGEGRLDYEGTRHVLLPGRTMLLTFPHANRYYLERGRSWEYFWIILSGREALRLAGAILAVEGPVVTPAVAAVDRLAGACLALLSGTADTPGAVSASAYSAMATLYDEAIGAVTGYADLPAAVLRAQRFVAENLGRKIDVAMLAQAAGLSRAHFVRMFTGAVGVPPSDYVFEKRMERATRMLLATDATVGAVARACGFADANYFSKAFRRAQGCSPGDFRGAGRTGLLKALPEG